MKLDTQECLAAFKIVDQVDTQAGLPSSQFVRLVAKKSDLQMSLTGLCIGQAVCAIQEPGPDWTWYLDRRVLSAFLTSAKTKTIIVTVQKDNLQWQAGRQKVTMAGMEPIAGYATWGAKGTSLLKLAPELRKELAVHAVYAPVTAAADHLSAVCLCKGYGILASDSFVVSVCLDKAQTATVRLPVLLARLLSTVKDATSVLVDNTGAGIKYPQGYLYQPLSDNCIKSYPLKKICGVVTAQMAAPVTLKVKAKVFLDTLSHLKNFIFGSDTDLQVTCRPAATAGMALLSLDVMQGQAQTSMAAEYTKDFKLTWMIAKILPWVEYVAGLDPEQVITCGQKDGCHIFAAKDHKQHRLLIVAESV